jgi:hypothetical protein
MAQRKALATFDIDGNNNFVPNGQAACIFGRQDVIDGYVNMYAAKSLQKQDATWSALRVLKGKPETRRRFQKSSITFLTPAFWICYGTVKPDTFSPYFKNLGDGPEQVWIV